MDSRYRNAMFFLIAAILTGGMYVANKAGLTYLPPVFFASLRFLIAAALLLPYVALRSERLRPRMHTDYLTILASGGLVVGAANAFLFVGQQYTTSATAAIIISLSPILTVGLAAALLPSSLLSWRGVFGVVLGLVGVGIVAQTSPSNLVPVTMLGDGDSLSRCSSARRRWCRTQLPTGFALSACYYSLGDARWWDLNAHA